MHLVGYLYELLINLNLDICENLKCRVSLCLVVILDLLLRFRPRHADTVP